MMIGRKRRKEGKKEREEKRYRLKDERKGIR